MSKIQDFLKRKGIEDIVVTYDANNEPVTPSYIIEEWEKEESNIGPVSKLFCECRPTGTLETITKTCCGKCGKEVSSYRT